MYAFITCDHISGNPELATEYTVELPDFLDQAELALWHEAREAMPWEPESPEVVEISKKIAGIRHTLWALYTPITGPRRVSVLFSFEQAHECESISPAGI